MIRMTANLQVARAPTLTPNARLLHNRIDSRECDIVRDIPVRPGISCRLNAALRWLVAVHAAWKPSISVSPSMMAAHSATYDAAMEFTGNLMSIKCSAKRWPKHAQIHYSELATLSPSVAIAIPGTAAFVLLAFSALVRVRGRPPAAFQNRLCDLRLNSTDGNSSAPVPSVCSRSTRACRLPLNENTSGRRPLGRGISTFAVCGSLAGTSESLDVRRAGEVELSASQSRIIKLFTPSG